MLPDRIHLGTTHELVIESYNFRANEILSFRDHGMETGTEARAIKQEFPLRSRGRPIWSADYD